MSSVREIARQTGVSIATVSRVLNNRPGVSDSSREKILTMANDKRYVPTVRRRAANNIAFLYTGDWSLGSPFDAALMQGMSHDLSDDKYDLLIMSANSRPSHETYTHFFHSRGVRGVVLRTDEATRHVCLAIAEEGFPSVVVAESFEDTGIKYVCSGAKRACRSAVDHLIHLGHRRIAIALNTIDDHDHRQRLEAYKEELSAAGMPADERMILRIPAHRQAGALALRQIMGMRDRPTAVFISDPMTAVGLMREAQRMQVKIPQDLSVIGFDDSDVRFGVYPQMSAVCQDAENLGREAFAVLGRLISGEKAGTTSPQSLECWLEHHDSTAPPARTES